jgi:transcriptional regulator with XRE-family HTH domain
VAEGSTISERIASLIPPRGRSEFARSIGVATSTLKQITEGSVPGADKIPAIVAATGVSYRWLLTGEGPKFEGAAAEEERPTISEVDPQGRSPLHQRFQAMSDAGGPVDPELLGRVVDRIARVYRELRIELPPLELGRLAAEKYAEISRQTEDREEWAPALDLMAIRVRKAALSAVSEPGSGKAQA